MSAECAGKVLAELRRALVEARAEHRSAEDALKFVTADEEYREIEDHAQEYGRMANEPSRARWLATRLEYSQRFLEARETERQTRTECERLGAEIAIHEDARRRADDERRAAEIANKERELTLQERLVAIQEQSMTEPRLMIASGGVAHG